MFIVLVFIVAISTVHSFPGVPGYGGGSVSKSSSSRPNFGVAVVPVALPSTNYGPNPSIGFAGDSYEEDEAPGVGYVGSQHLSAPSPTYFAVSKQRGPSSTYGASGSSSFSSSGSFGSSSHGRLEDNGPSGFGGSQPVSVGHFINSGAPSFGKTHASPSYGNGGISPTSQSFGGLQSAVNQGAHHGHYDEPQRAQIFGKGRGKGSNKGVGGYGSGVVQSFPSSGSSDFGGDFSTSYSSSSSFDESGPVFQPNRGGLQGAHYSGSPILSPSESPSYEAGPYSAQGLTGATYSGSPSVGAPTSLESGCCGGKKNKIYAVPIAFAPIQAPSPYAAAAPAYAPAPAVYAPAAAPAPAPKRPKVGY